jgi:hypothetical protein
VPRLPAQVQLALDQAVVHPRELALRGIQRLPLVALRGACRPVGGGQAGGAASASQPQGGAEAGAAQAAALTYDPHPHRLNTHLAAPCTAPLLRT